MNMLNQTERYNLEERVKLISDTIKIRETAIERKQKEIDDLQSEITDLYGEKNITEQEIDRLENEQYE